VFSCTYADCDSSKHFAKNFCQRHYYQYRKGWLTDDGQKTESWQGNPYYGVSVCRFNACERTNELRKGLCSKHYKWFLKGHMTEDCTVLKQPTERGTYATMTCMIPGCEDKPRRNKLCCKHSARVKDGRLSLDGVRNSELRPLRCTDPCKVCKKNTDKMVKGFCRIHYEHYLKGIVDLDGNKLRDLKKVPKYADDAQCKAKGCRERPRGRGFCTRHLAQYGACIIDDRGIPFRKINHYNRGKTCKAPGCSTAATIKGYCGKHDYRRSKGYLNIEDTWVNKGKLCKVQDCGADAKFRQMCSPHYYVWRKIFSAKKKAFDLDLNLFFTREEAAARLKISLYAFKALELKPTPDPRRKGCVLFEKAMIDAFRKKLRRQDKELNQALATLATQEDQILFLLHRGYSRRLAARRLSLDVKLVKKTMDKLKKVPLEPL